MKVWELIAKLSKYPAGADVFFAVQTGTDDGFVEVSHVETVDDCACDPDGPNIIMNFDGPNGFTMAKDD